MQLFTRSVQGHPNPIWQREDAGNFLNPYHKNSLMSLADTFPVPCGSAFCLVWQLFTSSSLITVVSSGLNPLQWPRPLRWWSYIQVPVNKEVCFDNLTCLPTSVSGAGQL